MVECTYDTAKKLQKLRYDPNAHTKMVCECPSYCGLTGNTYTCNSLLKCEKNCDCAPSWWFTVDPALEVIKNHKVVVVMIQPIPFTRANILRSALIDFWRKLLFNRMRN